MKSSILIFNLLLTTPFWVFGQAPKKQIRTEKAYFFSLQSGVKDSARAISNLKEYDRKGNIVVEVVYCYYPWNCKPKNDSLFKTRYEYQYDAQDNVIEERFYTDGQMSPLTIKQYHYTLNDKGEIIEKATDIKHASEAHGAFRADREIEKYTYNAQGSLIKEVLTSVYPDYSIDHVKEYMYNKNKQLIKFSGDNTKEIYTFDTLGRRTQFEVKGNVRCADDLVFWEKKFDAEGNLAEKTTCTARPVCATTSYYYNNQKQKVKTKITTTFGKDRLDYRSEEFIYNANGDVSAIHKYHDDKMEGGTLFEYEYYSP